MRRLLPLACVWLVIAASGDLYADDVWLVPLSEPSMIRFLLRHEAVQKELQIDAAQRPKLQKVLEQWQLAVPDLDALSPAERDRKIDELLDNADLGISTEDALARALTPEQQTRVNQLLVQLKGIKALKLATVARRLELSDAQQERIRKILSPMPLSTAALLQKAATPDEKPATPSRTREQEEQDVIDVLTPEQRAAWEKLVGPSFDIRVVLPDLDYRLLHGSPPTLLVFGEVRRELGINADQERRLKIQRDKIREDLPPSKWPLSEEERTARIYADVKARSQLEMIAKRALARVLSHKQLRRLEQLDLQRRGSWAFLDLTISDRLGLTLKQSKRALELTAPPDPDVPPWRHIPHTNAEQKAAQERHEKIKVQLLELLTPEQRMVWEELLGPKFDFGFMPKRYLDGIHDRDGDL